MQSIIPFANIIGSFDFSSILPNLKNMYVDNANNLRYSDEGFKTTLENYNLKLNNCLDSCQEAKKIKDLIIGAAKEYATVCGFTNQNLEPEIIRFWLNEQVSDVPHKLHNHNISHFSGCIYVDMPVGCSGIYFVPPTERYDIRPLPVEVPNQYNAEMWEYLPSEGQMLIWQSWMKHGVNSSKFEGIRRVVGFDLAMEIKEKENGTSNSTNAPSHI